MRLLINLCKKQFLIFFIFCFVASIACLTTVCLLPHGSIYSATVDIAGIIAGKEIVNLHSDGTGEHFAVVQVAGETEKAVNKFEYVIADGELFVRLEGNLEFEYNGKIDAFTLVTTSNGITITFKCYVNINLRTAMTVIAVVSIFFITFCAIIGDLDKHGVFTRKKSTFTSPTPVAA